MSPQARFCPSAAGLATAAQCLWQTAAKLLLRLPWPEDLDQSLTTSVRVKRTPQRRSWALLAALPTGPRQANSAGLRKPCFLPSSTNHAVQHCLYILPWVTACRRALGIEFAAHRGFGLPMLHLDAHQKPRFIITILSTERRAFHLLLPAQCRHSSITRSGIRHLRRKSTASRLRHELRR